MYPCFVWTWAPVIYSPLSGSVTQDIAPTFVSFLSAVYKQMDVVASQLSVIHEQNDVLANAMLGPALLSAETAEQGQARDKLRALREKFDRLERRGKAAQVEQAEALLDLIRREDPDRFARLVQAEVLRGRGDAPRE